MKKDITFNKRADKYDKGLEGRLSHKFYDNLIAAADITENAKVLEVGCGTGTVLFRVNQTTPIMGYGIDVSETMLENAKKKNPQMTFQIGDCRQLPFENNSLDAVMTCMAYHHFGSQKKFREEAKRVLKPGGKLYICDPNWPGLVRVFLNFIFTISKVEARFYKPEVLMYQFTDMGFKKIKHIKDAYVQVLVLESP